MRVECSKYIPENLLSERLLGPDLGRPAFIFTYVRVPFLAFLVFCVCPEETEFLMCSKLSLDNGSLALVSEPVALALPRGL